MCPACRGIIRLCTFAPPTVGFAAVCAALSTPQGAACAIRLARDDAKRVYPLKAAASAHANKNKSKQEANGDDDEDEDDDDDEEDEDEDEVEDESAAGAEFTALCNELRRHLTVLVRTYLISIKSIGSTETFGSTKVNTVPH